jgi:hypothetical protein
VGSGAMIGQTDTSHLTEKATLLLIYFEVKAYFTVCEGVVTIG